VRRRIFSSKAFIVWLLLWTITNANIVVADGIRRVSSGRTMSVNVEAVALSMYIVSAAIQTGFVIWTICAAVYIFRLPPGEDFD